MSDADKQFRISIVIDGAEQAVKATGKTTQAIDDLAKTIGTTSSSGGSGLTRTIASVQKATEAQAKASEVSSTALKKETEAVKENTEAKKENARASEQAAGSPPGNPADSPKSSPGEAIKQLGETLGKLQELKKAMDEAAGGAEKLNQKTGDGAGRAEKAVGKLTSAMEWLSKALKETSQSAAGYDEHLSNVTAKASETIGTLSKVFEGAVSGFSAGGPIGAAVGGGVKWIEHLLGKVNEANAEAARSLQHEAEFAEQIHQRQKRRRSEEITKYYDNIRDSIDATVKSLQAYDRIQEINQDAAVKMAQADVKLARYAGGANMAENVAGNEARARDLGLEKTLGQVDRTMAEAAKLWEAALETAGAKQKEYEEFIKAKNGTQSDGAKALAAERDAAFKAVDNAAESFGEIKIQTERDTELLSKQTEVEFAELRKEQGDIIHKAGEDALDKFDKAMEEQGGITDANVGEFRRKLAGLLEDAVPDEQQADKIREVIGQLRDTQQNRDRKVYDGLDTLQKTALSAERSLGMLAGQLTDALNRVTAMEMKIRQSSVYGSPQIFR